MQNEHEQRQLNMNISYTHAYSIPHAHCAQHGQKSPIEYGAFYENKPHFFVSFLSQYEFSIYYGYDNFIMTTNHRNNRRHRTQRVPCTCPPKRFKHIWIDLISLLKIEFVVCNNPFCRRRYHRNRRQMTHTLTHTYTNVKKSRFIVYTIDTFGGNTFVQLISSFYLCKLHSKSKSVVITLFQSGITYFDCKTHTHTVGKNAVCLQ